MEKEEPQETGLPGVGHTHGNFWNYYAFNPPSRRLELLPNSFAPARAGKELVVADIGCNEGDITLGLYHFLRKRTQGPIHLYGLDLDQTLIERAKNKLADAGIAQGDIVEFHCSDITADGGRLEIQKLAEDSGGSIDLITCFSTTMWIHVHVGDEKFREFLSFIAKFSIQLLLEPQPWKCYKTASHRWRKKKLPYPEPFKTLLWRNDVVEEIANFLLGPKTENRTAEKFDCVEIFGETEWERKLHLFSRTSGSSPTEAKM